MKLLRHLFSFVVTLVLLSQSTEWAIAHDAEDFAVITGSVAYRQRIALPLDAVLSVRVEDVSRADAPAVVLAETSEPLGSRQVPVDFTLKVAKAAIDQRSSYAVRATIMVNGSLRFTTTRSYPVLTRGAHDQVNILLEQVTQVKPAAVSSEKMQPPVPTLLDTYWKLTELNGHLVPAAPNQQREVHISLSGEGSRVSAFSGCNRLIGSYRQDGSLLRFTQTAGTMMACSPPEMELERQVLKMIGAVTGYRIEDQQLLLLEEGQVLARFEAVYL